MLRIIDGDFQREVLEKLGRLEAKMDMLAGNGQPGRMKLAEDRIARLERNDVRNGVYNRMVNGAISAGISVVIALHKFWWK
ncbi:MAG TPA: hypothetical protein VMU61_06195 [Candidatus Aquilonibacter sp.]|nr:hypothetical protein [Candidatus Aquilonibacter sp.]